MTLRTACTRVALLPLVIAALLGAVPDAQAATGVWSPVPSAWSATEPIHDVWAFGATGIAAVGEGGHIYLSRDGGASWDVSIPRGQQATVFTAVTFDPAGSGLVAAGDLLLVTSDGGTTWRQPAQTAGGGPTSIDDLALRGTHALAACAGGVIMESDDGGQTWSRAAIPPSSDLTCVAIAGDGTAVAGGSGGEVLVERDGVWTRVATAPGPVTSLAAASAPVWGDGTADLFVAAAAGILSSDDGRTFTPVDAMPNVVGPPLLAWVGVPEPALLLAAGGRAGFYLPTAGTWRSGDTGLQMATSATASEGQSVAYVLGDGGRLLRTLSAGLEPATLVAGRSRLATGQSTRLRATVSVGARGILRLRTRLPGSAWQTVRSVDWRTSDWGREVTFDASPSLTHDYRLEFVYEGVATRVTPVTTIVVTPRIATARSRYDLRVGDVFRFSGTVAPALRGERIELLTDRGGGWRPVSGSARVQLRDGHAWTSRAFGTPRAETYRLRAHLPATARHAEAWSRIVTVAIRR